MTPSSRHLEASTPFGRTSLRNPVRQLEIQVAITKYQLERARIDLELKRQELLEVSA